MVDKTVINHVRHYLKTVNETGIRVTFGVIFGSHARGEATSESDVDVMVVSPLFDGNRKIDDVAQLWKCAAKSEENIEPIACGEKQWVEDEGSPIIEIARQQGQIVKLAEEISFGDAAIAEVVRE
jgi:predicted nucleotidyltransferase